MSHPTVWRLREQIDLLHDDLRQQERKVIVARADLFLAESRIRHLRHDLTEKAAALRAALAEEDDGA